MKCDMTRIPGRRLEALCRQSRALSLQRPQIPVATREIVDGSTHRNVHSICSCHLRGRRLLRNIAPESLRPCWIGPLGLANAGDPSARRGRCETIDCQGEQFGRKVLARNRLITYAKRNHPRQVIHRLTYGQRDPITDQFFTAKVLEV